MTDWNTCPAVERRAGKLSVFELTSEQADAA